MIKKYLLFIIMSVAVGIHVYGLPTQGLILAQQTVPSIAKKGWVLTADGFIVTDLHKNERKKSVASKELTITVDTQDIILINGKSTGTTGVRIMPAHGSLKYNGNAYAGHVIVHCNNGTVSLMHHTNQPKDMKGCTIGGCESCAHDGFPEYKRGTHMVRVLLDKKTMCNDQLWQFACPDGFLIGADATEQEKGVATAEPKIAVKIKNGALIINNKKHPHMSATIMPRKGYLAKEGVQYQGSFTITQKDDELLLINNLPLEDYIYCVLKSESWPGWPLEINKVMAIACRTYVMAMIMNAHVAGRPYHVHNTNRHQVYAGLHKTPVLKQAVAETKGIFVAYDNKPIVAMFDACCGGAIPAHIKGINFNEAPYLKRTYACTFCSSSKNYKWHLELSGATIANALKGQESKRAHRNKKTKVHGIKSIRIASRDDAGLVQKMVIKDQTGQYTIEGHRFRTLLPKLKSVSFTVDKKGDTFIFNGHGMGHQRGLCQWGAREMVRQGYAYDEILAFYYPKTSLMQLA